MKSLASITALREGKKSEASIGNHREMHKVTLDVLAESVFGDGLLYGKWKAQIDKRVERLVKKALKAAKAK